MKYTEIKKLSDLQFYGQTGISWSTFYIMLDELKLKQSTKNAKNRPPKLGLEDHLLLYLEYRRNAIKCFDLGRRYGISETSALSIIDSIEEALMLSGKFHFPQNIWVHQETHQ